MDVLQAIRTKRAVRSFSDQPVPDDVIDQILNAGRRSQSSKNTQPWQFIIIRERERLIELSKTGTYAGHIVGAAFAVVLVGEQPANGTADLDRRRRTCSLRRGAGVGSCIATLHRDDAGRRAAGYPEDRSAMIALSFGYPAPDWKSNRADAGSTVVRQET
ncbi:MAG: nitroreductase family protein [Anaerolineae bacterium]|nr:nitroreductase family protein [Anaerolineae bacterium]